MSWVFQNDSLIIEVPNRNQGKFRFKRRMKRDSFGVSFAATKEKFDEHVYLEWQISYDVPVASGDKTGLNRPVFKFKSANGKEKYPYELSEYLFGLVKNRLLKAEVLDSLQQEIQEYRQFFTVRPEVKKQPKKTLNSLCFDSALTELPTYFYLNKDGAFSEIIVQKQQYGAGFQAMVYFCIPLKRFCNGKELIGRTAKERPAPLTYRLDMKSAENIVLLFKILAMASPNHQKDALEILKVLKKGLAL